MLTATHAERKWQENMALGAAVVYVLNCLLYTQPAAPMWEPLRKYVPMRVANPEDPLWDSDLSEAEDVQRASIGHDQGLFFFGMIHSDRDIFRLSRHHIVPLNDIVRLYDEPSDLTLRARFGGHGVIEAPRCRSNPLRHNNRMVKTSRITTMRAEPIPVIDFGLTAREIPIAAGLDISGPDADAEVAQPDEPNGMDERLSNIWYQMLFDVIRKAPNPRDTALPSYINLSPMEHSEIEEEMYKVFEIPFRNMRYKVVDAQYWQVTMFDRFFPRQNATIPARQQNFKGCDYFEQFTALMGSVSKQDSEAIRAALLPRWKGLYWMPITSSDRMWVTRKANTSSFTTVPENHNQAAPQIAINPFVYRYGRSVVKLRGAPDPNPE